MMRLGPLRSHVLKAIDGLEIHVTDVSRACITDAPSLTLQELCHGRFGELAAGHQGPFPLGELPGANGAAQPLDMFVFARPRLMHKLPSPGRLNRAHCGFGHENRVYLSCAGVVGLMIVLLWQGMDRKIRI
jgi:hypothetical protein